VSLYGGFLLIRRRNTFKIREWSGGVCRNGYIVVERYIDKVGVVILGDRNSIGYARRLKTKWMRIIYDPDKLAEEFIQEWY